MEIAVNPEDILQTAKVALLAGDATLAERLTAPLVAEHGDRIDLNYLRAATLAALGDGSDTRVHIEAAWLSHAVIMLEEHDIDVARMAAEPAYAIQVAMMFYREGYVGPAALACGLAINDLKIAAEGGLFLYGQILQHHGRIEAALSAYDRALTVSGADHLPGFILYALFFARNGVERHSALARQWGESIARFTPSGPVFKITPIEGRKLRIGYVAPSFTRNQTRQFVLPVFEGHDPDAFEIFVYVDDAEAEDLPDHVVVRTIKLGAYDAAVELIRGDAIDILVDVWGHASGNNLPVFARRAAPVQVTWLNYMQTTGLGAMDYSLIGHEMALPGTEALFVEKLFDIGPVLAPFRPTPTARTSPAPALSRGFLVFASFNHPAKISDETVTGWAKMLKACPDSKLLFKYSYFVDPLLQATMQCRFLTHGVDPARILFAGHSKGDEYEQSFAEIDIALDPVSCPGGTTTLEAFSRGVPVMGVRGQDFYSRITVEALIALGLPELLSEDWDEAAAKAAAFAADLPALDALRARVRPAFDASPYRDEAGVTRRLEAAFRIMFEAWSVTSTSVQSDAQAA